MGNLKIGRKQMSFIIGTFLMEVSDNMHGEDIEGMLDELQEERGINVIDWRDI